MISHASISWLENAVHLYGVTGFLQASALFQKSNNLKLLRSVFNSAPLQDDKYPHPQNIDNPHLFR